MNISSKIRIVVAILLAIMLFKASIYAPIHIREEIIWFSAIVILGIWLFFRGFVQLSHKRLVQNIPTSKIKSLAMGLVEIQGKASAFTPQPLKSPYAKMDCVFYHYEVQRFTRYSDGKGNWRTITEGSSGIPFYVDDGSGKVLVDSLKAQIKLGTRYISSNPDKRQAIPTLLRNGDMKYLETFIIPEEPIYALGTANAIKDYLKEHKQRVAKKLTEWWYNPEKREEFDLNQDGEIDKQEYSAMKEKTEDIVKQQEKEMGISVDLSGLSNIIITKGDEEDILIISNESEKGVISHIETKTILYIVGGVLSTFTAIILLCTRFK